MSVLSEEFRMARPEKKDEEFLADVRNARYKSDDFCLWWLGQSGFLLAWRGALLLIDPYLSDSLAQKYEKTATPHVRMMERVVDPARLEGITAVLATHHHTDHADPETLQAILLTNPQAR